MSGGKPPTNTFRENLSLLSDPGLWGDDRDGDVRACTDVSIRCEPGSSSSPVWSSSVWKNGDLPAERKKKIKIKSFIQSIVNRREDFSVVRRSERDTKGYKLVLERKSPRESYTILCTYVRLCCTTQFVQSRVFFVLNGLENAIRYVATGAEDRTVIIRLNKKIKKKKKPHTTTNERSKFLLTTFILYIISRA